MSIKNKIFLKDLILSFFFLLISIPMIHFLIEHFLTDPSGAFLFKKKCKILIFSLLSGFIIFNRFFGMLVASQVLKPIQQIFNALRSFKEGEEEFFPPIVLKAAVKEREFSKLASILNALTKRIQRQIENLTKQQEETKKILESLGEGVIALDPSAKVTFANSMAIKILKVSMKEILGNTLYPSKSDLLEKCHQLILHALQTSEPIRYNWIVREKTPLYLQLVASPQVHQEGALLVLQDKTSDYKIVEMGKDFVANASHELRTPITIIKGFAETLQDLPDLDPKVRTEITQKIVKTCGRLDKLVRSLLTLADVENHPPDRLKKTDLIPLIENCIHLVKTANPKVNIQFDTKLELAMISADGDLLELAILNVLENGIKYSKELPSLQIELQEKEGGIRLLLKDNGIGMSDSDLTQIFDRFYTVDKARSRKSGGAGLGLSIVKTIIDKHRGKIDVHSILGKGSTFTFILPKIMPIKNR